MAFPDGSKYRIHAADADGNCTADGERWPCSLWGQTVNVAEITERTCPTCGGTLRGEVHESEFSWSAGGQRDGA